MRLTFLIAACYGTLLEFIQWKFYPLRSFDKYDVMANLAGCSLFTVVAILVSRSGNGQIWKWIQAIREK